MGCSLITHGQECRFSADALAFFQQEAQQSALVHHQTQQPEKRKKNLTTEQLYSAINTLACIYVLARIAQAYHGYFIVDTPPTTWYDNLVPIRNTVLVKKMRFAIASLLILGETLLGKSLAKLIILCATGDVTDLIEALLVRVKKIVVA